MTRGSRDLLTVRVMPAEISADHIRSRSHNFSLRMLGPIRL